MKKYLVEIVLAAVMIAVFFGVSAWQSVDTLSKSEVDNYVGILEKSLPAEWEERGEFIARMRAWGESDDGRPVFMLNVMRFYEQNKPFPGVPAGMTPSEANAHYEEVAIPMLLSSGGYPIVGGDSLRISSGEKKSNLIVYEPDLDNWDRVIVVRYPGRRTFFNLVTNPEYIKVMPYKLASLEVVLTPVAGEIVVPDLRWIAAGSGLGIFLLVGWVRAVRRKV